MQGRFITFEGGEGSGKSTQARLLASYLRSTGLNVLETREPGGSPFAERVRALILDPATPPHAALSEALLFYAARSDHIIAAVRPALALGTWVVCDRFSDSTRVYQGAAGGLDTATLDRLEEIVVGSTVPDLTILLDIDPLHGLGRARSRQAQSSSGAGMRADAYEGRDLAFHGKLRAGYLALAEREPGRFAVLDATLPVDDLAARVRQVVADRLGSP
ncbi:MAG: dTMP kinase [Hyphomicrobiaceae bacterium]|nr:dTMP kinase [Hyphomicrobiaceae bacterium]